MTTPSANRFAYSKQYLVLGPLCRPRVEDSNVEETGKERYDPSLYGPVPRFGSTLMLMWRNVARVLNGGDSYQQEHGNQAFGSVASYSWSGGGSGSTKSYTFGSSGLQEITLTVTDDNGVSTTGRRWVRVVDPALVPLQAITAFTWSNFTSDLGGGLGGSRISIEVFDPTAFLEDFAIGRMVAIYLEEYEGATSATQALVASGEVFVGYVLSVEHELRPDGDRLRFMAGTIEQLVMLEGVVDGGDHLFLDESMKEAAEGGLADPMAGPIEPEEAEAIALANLYPAHIIPYLTIGKVAWHLLRYHLLVEIDGTSRSLVEMCDFIRDWWNDGSAAIYKSFYFNIPRGNLMRALVDMLPQGLWIIYGKRNGGLVMTKIHAAKTVADAVVDTISEAYCYAGAKPTKGLDSVVRQVVLMQATDAERDNEDDLLVAKYPASPAASGSLYQPRQQFWVINQVGLETLAENLYDEMNATDRYQVSLRGHPFDLHNIAQVTVTGRAAFPWTNKKFQTERVEFDRDHEWMGPIGQMLSLREIP